VLVAAASPAGPARAAGASALYTRVLHAYQAHGRIPPCQFTSPQLESALSSVDTYGQQYYADFIGAIQTALTARASGVCSHGHQHSAAASTSSRGSSGGTPGAPALPSSVTAPTGSGLPLPILLLAAVAALLAAAASLAYWARLRGWEAAWAASWRHGAGEARFRARGRWDYLVERLRR